MSSTQDRRSKLAISLLEGKHDSRLEQIERLTNGEQNPLEADCFAALNIDGNVVDVEFTADDRVFAVVKQDNKATLWEIGFPNRFVAEANHLDLLGMFGNQLFYRMYNRCHETAVEAEPHAGHPIRITIPFSWPSSLLPTVHPMADGKFVVVWQVMDGDDSVLYIGDFETGNVEKCEKFDKFVPLEGGGYVVFWRGEHYGMLLWVKPSGERYPYRLSNLCRGDTAAVINGELWFSEVNRSVDAIQVVHLVNGKRKVVFSDHNPVQVIFDGIRPAVYYKHENEIVYLDKAEPKLRFLCDPIVDSFVPIRFGSWLLFQTQADAGEYALYGCSDKDLKTPVLIVPGGPQNIARVYGNHLLVTSINRLNEFLVFDCRRPLDVFGAVHQLPSGCKIERLRIVGDNIFGWSTVGRTLNLFRIPI